MCLHGFVFRSLREQMRGLVPPCPQVPLGIYLIATNYIMGFDERFKENNPHFVQEDAAEAAKNGCLAERVNAHFGV